jgi:predicted methyltransferase
MITFSRFALALAISVSACAKSQTTPPVAEPEPVAAAPMPAEPAPQPPETSSEDPTATPPADKEAQEKTAAEAKRKEAERAAAAMAELEANTAAEQKRWTPKMEKKVAALVKKDFKTAKAALRTILKSEHRVPGNAARDIYRHPIETLTFFGIRPDMTVVELGIGEGWYTELLAPLLARRGKLIAVSYDPAGPPESMRTVYGQRLARFLQKSPALFGKVQAVAIAPPEQIELGAPGSADMVVAIREMHGWQRRGDMDAYLAAVHAVLKEGGVFGVVQHRAASGADVAVTVEKGYLPETWLIEKVESAGFQLAEKSEINANPKDTKDYPGGVWTLPPNLSAVAEADVAKYKSIGESDRMTLRFVKKSTPH